MTNTQSTAISRRTAIKVLAGVAAAGSAPEIARGTVLGHGRLAHSDDTDGTCAFGSVFEDVVDSLVTIRVFDRQAREFAQGSGWVYALDEGTVNVVTNWHVIFGSLGADVRFHTGEWRAASELLGFDLYSDLAVLRVEDPPSAATELSISDSLPRQGDSVAALGAPIGLEETITTGVVSAVNRSTTVGFEHFMYNVPSTIQIDAATNPGNSGGPLVDCNRNLVGVIFAGTGPLIAENINFAVSKSMVTRIVPELVETGSFEHPYIGIHGITISPMLSRLNEVEEDTQGVYVEQTVDSFPGDLFLQGSTAVDRETGIPIGGDVLIEIDGNAIGTADELRNYLFAETRPEESITVTLLRDSDEREVEFMLEAKPDELERIQIREPTM